jgi:hypothetical protein
MDALIGNNRSGPGSSPTFLGYTIIMSKDIVAVDYNTIQLMRSKPNANTASLSRGEQQLKAAESAGLGTATPANMEIIEIGPPWKTGIIKNSESLSQTEKVQVMNRGNRVVFHKPYSPSQTTEITVFDLMGKLIWHKKDTNNSTIVWNNTSLSGSLVPSGMYIYRIKTGTARENGIIMISN